MPPLPFWAELRAPIDRWYRSLSLPHIDPNVYVGLSLLLAFLFTSAVSDALIFVAWVFLAAHLVFDGLAGALKSSWRQTYPWDDVPCVAQRADVFAGLACDLLIFGNPTFASPWLLLFVLNALLAVLSLVRQRSYILPLRQVFFVYFTLTLLFRT